MGYTPATIPEMRKKIGYSICAVITVACNPECMGTENICDMIKGNESDVANIDFEL